MATKLNPRDYIGRMEDVLGMTEKVIQEMPYYYGVLLLSFAVLGVYSFASFGVKKAIIISSILAIIEIAILFLRLLLISSLGMVFHYYYSFLPALAVFAAQIIVLFIAHLVEPK